jgi:hypothetical protein
MMMSTTSYMIFVDPNNRRYAIKSDECLTFATDPGDKKYQGYLVDSKDQIIKNETVSVLRTDLDPAGCVITEPTA